LDSKDGTELSKMKVNKDKYKIKFTLSTKGQSQETLTDICVRILKVASASEKDDQRYAVEF